MALLFAAALPGLVFRGEVLFLRDLHLIGYPQAESFVRSILAGSWPVWDPWVGFGVPLWANPDAQVAYPPQWLNLVLRPWTYYTVFAFGHFVVSGVGQYFLLRFAGASRIGAGFGAAAWVLSGPFVSLVNVWHHFASAALAPWVLLAALLAADRPNARRAAWWGFAQGLQLLAGSVEMCLLTLLATALLVGARVVRPLRSRARLVALALCAAGAGALALALSAATWLPAIDVAWGSARRQLSGSVATAWSLHPWAAAQIWLPVFLQELPLKADVRSALFEGRQPFLASIHLGPAVLALSVGCLAARVGRDRIPMAIGGLTALLLAAGRHAPFYSFAVWLFPPLAALRYPTKALALTALAASYLAGLGADAWLSRADSKGARGLVRLSLLVAAAVPLALWAGFGLLGSVWNELLDPAGALIAVADLHRIRLDLLLAGAAAALVLLGGVARSVGRSERLVLAGLAVAVADLAWVNQRVNPTTPPALLTYRPPLVDAVRQDDGRRLYVYNYHADVAKSVRHLGRTDAYAIEQPPAGWPVERIAVLAQRLALVPPVAAQWGIEGSFDQDLRGLGPPGVATLARNLRSSEETPVYSRLLRIGAVGRVVARHSAGLEDLSLRAQLPSLFEQPFNVYDVPGAVPRAFAMGGSRSVSGPEAAAEAILSPAFDPTREVVLESSPDQAAPADFRGAAHIDIRKPDRVAIEADLSHDGFVVLVDAFAPGWEATVDGSPAPVLRANAAFRAVPVRRGRHRVVMLFRPPAVRLGLALSVLGATVLVGLALAVRRPCARGEAAPAARSGLHT
jgi:hypothetical protein